MGGHVIYMLINGFHFIRTCQSKSVLDNLNPWRLARDEKRPPLSSSVTVHVNWQQQPFNKSNNNNNCDRFEKTTSHLKLSHKLHCLKILIDMDRTIISVSSVPPEIYDTATQENPRIMQ